MIQLPIFETFAFVTYFIANAFLAREIVQDERIKRLHWLAYGALILGAVIVIRFMI